MVYWGYDKGMIRVYFMIKFIPSGFDMLNDRNAIAINNSIN
jgi:hypothetical protein